MRVLAGRAKGVPLKTVPDDETRPILDRVKKSLFSILDAAGLLQDARVLDLYAGTGVQGIEALSRGAAAAVFVERRADAVRLLRDNLQKTRLSAQAEARCEDAGRFLQFAVEREAGAFRLCLFDPPFAFSREAEFRPALNEQLAAAGKLLAPDGRLVLRTEKKAEPPAPRGLTLYRRWTDGPHMLLFYGPAEASGAEISAEDKTTADQAAAAAAAAFPAGSAAASAEDGTEADKTAVEPALFCWSGGKDGAFALDRVRRAGRFRVEALLTTVTEDYGRVSMHGVRRELLLRQAEELGAPLGEVLITKNADNAEYEARMEAALRPWREKGVRTVLFGDIFLADLRVYREERLARVGMRAAFPLWKEDTARLVREGYAAGFRAVIVCADGKKLPASFAGRELTPALLDDLPAGVDPCGENGEFHSFIYAGPIFRRPISWRHGETVTREGFHFHDLFAD